jgi:CDP-glycerol glycerophosphotransferase
MLDPVVFELCKDLEKISKSKKKKPRILFFGRETFSDNSKYLYLHMIKNYPNIEVVWCSCHASLIKLLQENNLPCFNLSKDLKLSAQFIIESAVSVFCINPLDAVNANLVLLACLSGSISIQLWHGIGVKKIDLATTSFRDMTNLSITKSIGGAISAKYYLSPSSFVDEKWMEFFGARHFIRSSYPRNEVLLRDATDFELLGAELEPDIYHQLYNVTNKKILLAPTWMENSGLNDIKVLTSIIIFCRENNITVFIKKHPFVKEDSVARKNIDGVSFIPSQIDIYPHMKYFDAVVTDYSSIIFDYLLTGKPILTVGMDKGTDFDYTLIPGGDSFRYIFNHENVADVFRHALFDDDQQDARQKVRDLIFESDDGKANSSIAEKIIHIYDVETAQKHQIEIF